MKILTRLIQVVIISIPIVLLGWLVNQQFAPNGSFRVQYSVGLSSPFIDRLLPDARVNQPEQEGREWVEKLIGDPVFFFVHPQRQFDRAKFEIWFQNKDVKIVEFGGLARKNPEVYDLQPMQNLLIDQSNWFRLDDGETILLQRNKTFESIQEFLLNLPAPDKIAVYHTDLLLPFRLQEYKASDDLQTINVSLRGHHEFKTYINRETLFDRFEYTDMNRDEGADPIVVTVFDEQGRPVADARADDDLDLTKLGRPSRMRSLEVAVDGLEEGVYKIVFDSSRDIFIRNIKTTQNKFVVMNGVYLGDEIAYREPAQSVELFTTAKRIQAQTRHSDGVQTVHVGNKSFSIEEPYQLYTFSSESPGVIDIDVEKVDIELFVDQPIAFSAETFFNPEPNRLRYYTDMDAEGLDYVIAEYQSPEKRGGWYVANVDVDLNRLFFETEKPNLTFFREGNWKFVFSLPGIVEQNASMFVKGMNVTFQGRALSLREMIRYFQD